MFVLTIFLVPLIHAQYLSLNLHRHQSCPSKHTWDRKLEFEGSHNGKGATLDADPSDKGCYHIKGKVKVYEDVTSELLIYLSVSTTGGSSKPPEPCIDPHPETGCGGIGSCLFCRPCHSLEGIGKILGAQLEVDGKPIGCDVLRKGEYNNVSLRFCLPEVNKLIQWQGISEQTIDRILAATTQDSNGPPKLSLFVTVYMFDKDIRPSLVAQRRLETRIKQLRNISSDGEIDAQTYWNLPFNQMIHQQSQFIGCHKLFGTVSLTDKH